MNEPSLPPLSFFLRSKHIILGVLLFSTAGLLVGCHYYKVQTHEDVGEESLARLNEAIDDHKYFVIIRGKERKAARTPQLTQTSLEAVLSTLSSSRQQMHRSVETRGGRRYDPATEKQLTTEVRIFVKQGTPLQDGPSSISFHDIERIEFYDHDLGRTTTARVAGITMTAFAAVVLLAIASEISKDEPEPSGSESCPFVYTWNGNTYTLAGEVFGGAIVAPLERADYLPLPDLQAIGGEYHLRIVNELKEREFIDVAELIAIEHAEEIRAVVDKRGDVHTLGTPVPPVSAVSSGEVDYTDPMRKADQSVFAFTEGEGDVSSIVMTFPRALTDTTAKLILTAKTSPWLDYTFGKYTEQFGSFYDNWREVMSQKSSEELTAWKLNQSLPLKVYVETLSGWEYVDYFDMVGPLGGLREMVMPIALSNVTGDHVRVKLETGFLFWEVDHAAMDFSPNVPVEVRYLDPARATTLEGEDRTAALASDDGLFAEQHETGDAVDIFYHAPVPSSGNRITTVLHTKGYYEPIRQYTGIPNLAYLYSFRKPGRFTAFAKDKFLEYAAWLTPTYASNDGNHDKHAR